MNTEKFETCLEKQRQLIAEFGLCPDEESKYKKIIELGRKLGRIEDKYKIPSNIVQGCQSTVYLHFERKDGRIIFGAASEALISAGLAAILINVYSEETPEAVLKCPPNFLETLGINAGLTPSRANGLYSIHLRMKQDALKCLLNKDI